MNSLNNSDSQKVFIDKNGREWKIDFNEIWNVLSRLRGNFGEKYMNNSNIDNKICGDCADFTCNQDCDYICSEDSESVWKGCVVKHDTPACECFVQREGEILQNA